MKYEGQEGSSNLCIVTGYTPTADWNELAEVTIPSLREYATRWGHSLRVYTDGFDASRHSSWGKVRFLQDALPHYDWVFWVDTDAAITNQKIDVTRFTKANADVLICRDYAANVFNTGVFFVRNCEFSAWLLNEMWSRTKWANTGIREQGALVDIFREGKTGDRLAIFDGRDFNGFCEWKAELFGKPVEEEFQWHAGDFVAHCVGYSMTDRTWILKQAISLTIR